MQAHHVAGVAGEHRDPHTAAGTGAGQPPERSGHLQRTQVQPGVSHPGSGGDIQACRFARTRTRVIRDAFAQHSTTRLHH
jgi:hypothetical protein